MEMFEKGDQVSMHCVFIVILSVCRFSGLSVTSVSYEYELTNCLA